MVSATAATGVAVTASLPAVVGLRHYIDRIQITRSLTALQTSTAVPTVVTTTNVPGATAFTFGVDAGAQGVDREMIFDFGASGMACTNIGTATTVVAPVVVGTIWRINVSYRIGM